MTRDYNIINWHELVSYSEESPSGIVWATNRGCMFAGDIAGSKSFNKNGRPKCWDLRYSGKLWKIHRIIHILLNEEIAQDLVINHIDNNPFNNKRDNLEVVSQTTNTRRMTCHTGGLQVNNTTGFTGVSSVIRDGVLFGYRADAAQESGDKAFFLYSVARYGEGLALKLAMTTRTHMLEQRNREGAGYAEGSIYI